MSIISKRQLENTRAKLRRLEAHYELRTKQPSDESELNEMSLRSVRRIINQLKEEIARYETRARTA
jgi:hypothetical protein